MKSLPMPTSLKISDDCVITFSDSIRNLGFFIDSELKFTVHIIKVCQACFLELRRVSSIRHLLSTDATKTLVISLVLSRLDYCNSLLFGLPNTVLSRFQRIQNAAARLVLRLPRREHIILHFLSCNGSLLKKESPTKLAVCVTKYLEILLLPTFLIWLMCTLLVGFFVQVITSPLIFQGLIPNQGGNDHSLSPLPLSGTLSP